MINAIDESKLLKPGDLTYKADFWIAIESGELSKTIAWKLRKENNPKDVLVKATQELFAFVNALKTAKSDKPYRPTRKDIESFTKKFEKFYSEFHYLQYTLDFLEQFPKDGEDEDKFDKMNEYLWTVMFKVCETNVAESFKQWMVNQKRMMLGMPVHYPILFGLWSPIGGNGKSFLLECLARALSNGNLFVLNQWSDLESTSGSYLKDVFGVLYKDEIGTTRGIKDTIKSLITSTEVTIQCKYKEPIKLPKRFQLVCSANKPIGTRVFEDEAGYQRRDGTHECWGRLFDAETPEDLIGFFRKMFEYAPKEYRMSSVSSREFEFDEETIDMLSAMSRSPWMLDVKQTNASKAVKMASFSKICENLGVNKDDRDVKYYKLEALLEKSGCFERIKYGKVSTRYFRPIPERICATLEDVRLLDKPHTSIRKYEKPTVTKNLAQMMYEALNMTKVESKTAPVDVLKPETLERIRRLSGGTARPAEDEAKTLEKIGKLTGLHDDGSLQEYLDELIGDENVITDVTNDKALEDAAERSAGQDKPQTSRK